LAGAAFHETEDDVLGSRRNVRLLGRERIGRGVSSGQHGGERDAASPLPACVKNSRRLETFQ
jgi:hypothetical protein